MAPPNSIAAVVTCVAYMICFGHSVSDNLFEGFNKCGCYRLLSCATNAECSYGRNNLEEFYEKPSWSSETPKKCSKLFLEGYEKNITDSGNGTLKVAMEFSSDPANYFEHFQVQLIYIDMENVRAVHSKLHLQTTDEPCKKEVVFSFSYVFSGSYQLNIKDDYNRSCISGVFNVTTSYRKELIKKETESILTGQSQSENAELKTGEKQAQEAPFETYCKELSRQLNHSIASQTGKDLECTFRDNRLSQVKSIHVRVTNDTGNEYIMETHLTHEDRGNCCDYKGKLNYCPCKWYDNRSLKCSVQDVKIGKYKVVLEYIDPRCEQGTLWIKKNDACVWDLTKVVVQEGTELIAISEQPNTSSYASHAVFFVIVTSGIILLFILSHHFFKLKFSLKKWRVNNRNPHSYRQSLEMTSVPDLSREDASELLLLYPRDCETFMGIMKQFRMILKDSFLGKVYDPWDEDIFDEVAVSLETWSLPLITNDKAKIIIMLSQCSKIIEKAYIHDMYNLTYRNPNVLDRIFGQSLKALYQYFSTRSDCYQRVFVVRLDETSDMKLSFLMNSATIYTIPQGLETLLKDLAKNHFPRIREECLHRLETLIKEYKNLKEHHDYYLNEILEITLLSK